MCGASVGGSLLATGGKQDSDPARDPELGTSWLFHKAAGFPRNPSCPYKQRLQHRCEKALQQYWSGEKGRVRYSVDKGLRYTH